MRFEVGDEVRIQGDMAWTIERYGWNTLMSHCRGKLGKVVKVSPDGCTVEVDPLRSFRWANEDLLLTKRITTVTVPFVATKDPQEDPQEDQPELTSEAFFMIMRDDAKECHKKHLSYTDARIEATRLAKKVPGHIFYIMVAAVAVTQPFAPLQVRAIQQ